MISPQERFVPEDQIYFGSREDPETRCHCNVWDWDQLRMIKVKGTAKFFPPDEDQEIPVLSRFADSLSPDIRAIEVDDDGIISGVSKDLKDDDTPFIPHPPFSIVKSLAGCRTIKHSQLQELSRLRPGLDISSYKDKCQNSVKVAFKFNAWGKPQRLQRAWKEMNILKTLPSHPNIVPFDAVVLEDVESRVIGFTTKYIPGGTLVNPNVPFRFEWIQQLTQLVDFLNLDLGIMHQDIAPRNLLIDPDTQKILLFDFDWAACGKKGLLIGRDDITGVVFTLYELITNDTSFANIPHRERDIEMVQSISEWPRKRELDTDVLKFRNFLNGWVEKRQSNGVMEQYIKTPTRITWPDLPTAHDYDVHYPMGKTLDGDTIWRTGPRLMRNALEAGQYCFRWERPPQRSLPKRTCEEKRNRTVLFSMGKATTEQIIEEILEGTGNGE
ncbi:hypothetical protein SBOR_7588 [Sclerotinia borealis F-4128]|uniref:EKC/KEOPS complex subunit BUD32 n=1 Tax=Sclerotinia borealis (strain F-4128) TaxID=1432307 RepID=W9C5I8_SCLBF|nr:hypothetical protein SBOR_7588 [Sclerotinia borealis F-4128]